MRGREPGATDNLAYWMATAERLRVFRNREFLRAIIGNP
jgi:hypothetical protein